MIQPSLSYNLLKFSLQMFHCPPRKLEPDAHKAVLNRAEAECLLQKKVLESNEGTRVVIPEKSIEDAMAAVAERYESSDAFEQDLAKNDLDLSTMAAALEADLAVEATMAQVAAQVEPPSHEQVAEIFESTDKEKPEQRCLRHILITINDQFPENTRQAALERITKVRDSALVSGVDFSELAQRYSECPSALKGGSIKPVVRGSMHPNLEKALFTMEVGEISETIESNMGFHILLCEKVIPREKLIPEDVKAKIRKILHSRSKKKAVQTWLAQI